MDSIDISGLHHDDSETPMTEQLISQEQLSRLKKVQDYLVKNIPCQDDMFWNKICEYKVLSDQTIRDVRATVGSTPSVHTRKLLDVVSRGSKAMLHGLKRALLETSSGHVAKAIEDGKVPEEASAAGGRLAATPLQEGIQSHKENWAKSIMVIPQFDFARRGTTDLSKLYVPIYIVHNKEDRGDLNPAEVRSERIIPTEKIFKPYDGAKEPNTVLLEGAPGTGKTTFVKAYMYDWCYYQNNNHTRSEDQNQLDTNQWYLIVYLPVTKISTCIDQAIKSALAVKQDLLGEMFNLLLKYPANCLVIFDGIDECRDKKVLNDIRQFIEESKLGRKPRVIVTARTYLCDMDSDLFHRHLKCEGFTEDQACAYIDRYFHDDRQTTQEIKEKVSFANQSLTNPLRLYMMCLGIQTGLIDISKTDNLTSTMLFLSREQLLLQREAKKGDKQTLSTEEPQEWRNFTLLSLNAMLQGQRSLTPEMLKKAGIPDDSVVHLYLNKEYTVTCAGEKEHWTFLHETLYEFLSARGLELLHGEDQLCVLLYICSRKEFRNLMLLFVGLLGHNHGTQSVDVTEKNDRLIENMLKVCLVLQGLLDKQGLPPEESIKVKQIKEGNSKLINSASVKALIRTLCCSGWNDTHCHSREENKLKEQLCNEWKTVLKTFDGCVMGKPEEVFFGMMEEERYCGIIGHIVSCIHECQKSELNIIQWMIPGHWSGFDGIRTPLEKDVFKAGDERWVMVSYGVWQYGKARVFDAWCPEDAVFAWEQHERNEKERLQEQGHQSQHERNEEERLQEQGHQSQHEQQNGEYQSLEFRLPSPRESYQVWGNKGQAPKQFFAKDPWLTFFETVMPPTTSTREFHLYLAAENHLPPLLEAILDKLDVLKAAVSQEMEICGGYIELQELRDWLSRYRLHNSCPFSKLRLTGIDVVSDKAVENVLEEFKSESLIDQDTMYCKRTANTI